jgi:hypothetical protein
MALGWVRVETTAGISYTVNGSQESASIGDAIYIDYANQAISDGLHDGSIDPPVSNSLSQWGSNEPPVMAPGTGYLPPDPNLPSYIKMQRDIPG